MNTQTRPSTFIAARRGGEVCRYVLRIGAAAAVGVTLFIGSSYTAPAAEAAARLPVPKGIIDDLVRPNVRLPIKNPTIAEGDIQAMAQRAGVPLRKTTDLVTQSEVQSAPAWRRVSSSIGRLNTATEGPVRSAMIEAACTVLKGETVTVDSFVQYLYDAYRVKLTRDQARQLIEDTNELISDLREARTSSNQDDRVAAHLICYVAGVAA